MGRIIAAIGALALLVSIPNVASAGGGCPEGYTPQNGFCKPYFGPTVYGGYGGYGYGRYVYPRSGYRVYRGGGYRVGRHRRHW